MSDREQTFGSTASLREQVEAYKDIVETETIHELLTIHAATSKTIDRFVNLLLIAAALIAAAGLWQFERLIEVIGYGGAVTSFAILMLSGFVGLVSKDYGQRVEMMMPSLAPVSAISGKVAANYSERARQLERLGEKSGAPLRPGETDPDPTVIEASFAYPDTFLTRWAFGVTPSEEEGSSYVQVMSNIAYQAIAQKIQLACLVLLFAVVTAALLYRHGYSIGVGGSAQRIETCFAAHLKSAPALRELGHAGALSYCLGSHDSLEKWRCVSDKVSPRMPLAAAKKECRILEPPARAPVKPVAAKK